MVQERDQHGKKATRAASHALIISLPHAEHNKVTVKTYDKAVVTSAFFC